MATPYTYSRRRVLARYAAKRREGIIPLHAMEAVLAELTRMTAPPYETRRLAEREWDIAHAKRYLGCIDLHLRGGLDYWKRGMVR